MYKKILLLSIFTYFIQGFEGLPGQSFSFYLKNLGWTESKLMIIGSLITLAWMIKPLLGYYIDSLYTKKIWVIISLIGSILMASIIGLFTLPIVLVCILMALASTNTAIRDIAVDGLSVETGTEENKNSDMQSWQWISITIASCLVGIGGGFIADHFTYKLAFLCLIPVYIGILYFIIINNLKEKKTDINYNWKELTKYRQFWFACLFIFLYKFSPSTGTPLYYIQIDKFKWSQTWIGTLGTISSIISIVGAFAYQKYAQNINFKKWIIWSVWIGALTSLAYLYFTPKSCIIYTILFSFIGMIIHLLIMTFMANNCIKGMEGTSFAILCSVNNIANTASGLAGGFLFPIVGLHWLIIISSLTSFLCLPFINKVFIDK